MSVVSGEDEIKNKKYCGATTTDIFGVDRNLSLCMKSISKWTAKQDNLEYTDYDMVMLKRLVDVRMLQIDILTKDDDGKAPHKAYFPTAFVNIKERGTC